MRTIGLVVILSLLFVPAGHAQKGRGTGLPGLDFLADVNPTESPAAWREYMPDIVSVAIARTLKVMTTKISFNGYGKEARDIKIMSNSDAFDSAPTRWLLSPSTTPACTLAYVGLAAPLGSHPRLSVRERIDARIAHYAVAYTQCPTGKTIPEVAIRYWYAVALKEGCRAFDYLTCADSYDIFAALADDVASPEYLNEARTSPDRGAAIRKDQASVGNDEILYHLVTYTMRLREMSPEWRDADLCDFMRAAGASPFAGAQTRAIAASNLAALRCRA